MISDREFLDWEQALHTHYHLLNTHFMLKPLILDTLSLAYNHQFEHCTLNQLCLVVTDHHMSIFTNLCSCLILLFLLLMSNTYNQTLSHPPPVTFPIQSPHLVPFMMSKILHPFVSSVVHKDIELLSVQPRNIAAQRGQLLSTGSITTPELLMGNTSACSSTSGKPASWTLQKGMALIPMVPQSETLPPSQALSFPPTSLLQIYIQK